MRGMHRLLAAILLAGALGGLVVFARHLGRVPEPVAVRLSAPPPQHLTAPGAVHAPLLVATPAAAAFGGPPVAVRPLLQARTAPLTLSAAKPLTVPRVTTPTRHAGAPVAKPKPPATRIPVPAPPQEQVRVLAAVPLTPVDTATTVATPSTPISSTAAKPGNGKGHAYGHVKPQTGKSSSVPAPPPPPASVPAAPEPPAPVVELTPVDPGSAGSADADADQVVHGHGWGRGNGQGHRG